MKKLDRFILKSFLGPFVAVFMIVMFILVMQFLWLYIDELVGKGLGLGVILEFLFWGACITISTALPLSVLLASVMTLGNLGENNELLAIKAAGVSLGRVLVPLTGAVLVICVGAFFAANNLIPEAYNKIFTLRNDILRTKNEIKIPEKTFYDGIDGYVLRIDERDDETGMMHGVMVYDHTSNKGNVAMTMADSALMTITKDKQYLYFELFDGTSYQESNTKKYRDTTLQFQRIDFSHQELLISLENYAFEKSEDGEFKDEIKAMRLDQLEYQKDSLGEINGRLQEKHVQSAMSTGNLRYTKQLDTASTGISYDLSAERMDKWDNLDQQINAYKKAANCAKEMAGTLETAGHESYQYNYLLRRIDEGIYKKFSLALACLLFFFIGAPIGALIRKGGLGVPAIVAVLFFVFYWVIDVTGTKLARDGAVDSFSGVFISAYVLLPLGVWFTWSAVHDHQIISMDSIKNAFKKIKRAFSNLFHKTRIVYMGTPEFAVAPLEELLKNRYKIVAVVTVPDKASGRGLKVNESAVKKYAVAHDIPVYQPEKMKDPEFIEAMKALKPDLFVVVAFRLLPKEVWEIPTLGTFNLHAALLPQYRGAAPINWAIINGERVSGVTTFMIDDGVDTGKIMIREQVRIDEDETAGTLHDKLMELGAKVVVQTVEGLLDNDIEFRLQKTFIQGEEQLRPAPKITKELCHINWDKDGASVRNLIRGLSPYPGAYTELVKDGTAVSMKIYAATIAGDDVLRGETYEAGTILSDGKTYLAIATADGALRIDEMQLAGKKRMDVKNFLLGFRDPQSYKAS